MPVNERRQHFRIDDTVYFDYRMIDNKVFISDKTIIEDLLGTNNQKFQEAAEYFVNIDFELSELTQQIAEKEPYIAHYLNLINSKLDFLPRYLLIGDHIKKQTINLSLGGLAFHSEREIAIKSKAKVILYTKPKMMPVIANTIVSSCIPIPGKSYRISMHFENLAYEQQQLLSQHIMMAQLRYQVDS